jgi:hypothetical protein
VDGSADIFGAVFSCNGFSGFLFAPGCGPAAPLQTDLGDFTVNPLISLGGIFPGDPTVPMVGEFTARPLTVNIPEPSPLALLIPAIVVLVVQRRQLVN